MAIVRVLIPQKSANAVSRSLIDFHVDYFGLKDDRASVHNADSTLNSFMSAAIML